MIDAGPAGYALAFVLGALFGSFGNVVILRVPAGKSIVKPPSHCFACGTPIRWYDNLPILSYLLLRGRCRRCGAGYSPRYLFVELAMAILSVALFHLCLAVLHPESPDLHRLGRFVVYFFFTFVMLVVSVIDLDTKTIPDKITYPGIPFFVACALALGDRAWWEPLVGAAAGYGVIRLISDGYYHLFQREGMGYGDGKLLAMVGALQGWQGVAFSLFGGSILGSVIGGGALAVARARKPPAEGEPRLRHVELPFGPFLAAAALVYLFLEPGISVAWRRLVAP